MGIYIAAAVVALLLLLSVWNYRRFMPKPKAFGGENHKVAVEERSLNANGRHIYGELLTPAGKTGKLPTVICCHGYGSSYTLCKNMIGKSLAMSGFAAYCFDFCGGSKKTKSDWTMLDMSIYTEKEDLLAVIDFIKQQPEVDADRIYLLGESQGGMVAAITAVERLRDLKAMVLYYPAFCIPFDAHNKFASKDDIPDVTEAFRLPISRKYYADVWDMDVYREIAAYDKPVLIMHGDQDTVVDISYGRKGAESYPNARFEVFPGEIHGFYGKGKLKAAEMSIVFLQSN